MPFAKGTEVACRARGAEKEVAGVAQRPGAASAQHQSTATHVLGADPRAKQNRSIVVPRTDRRSRRAGRHDLEGEDGLCPRLLGHEAAGH